MRGGAVEPQDDTDSDGLTDWYEYNYTTNIVGMDASADDDGDGVSNGDENISGTIPTDVSSLLEFTDMVSETNGTIIVYWSSELDRTYRLTASSNLVDDAFSAVVASNLSAIPPVNEYTDDNLAESNRFYRVEVEE